MHIISIGRNKDARVTNLKRSFFWIAFYLLIILILAQLDRSDTPVINFAAYFYLVAIFLVPVMIFIPSLHKVSVVAPMVFWGAIYFAISRFVDRAQTGSMSVEVIVLEIAIVEVGVWLSMQDELPKVVAEYVSVLNMKALEGFCFTSSIHT